MFLQLWPGMTEDTRAQARTEIETLLGWCLTKSLNGGGFEPSPDMSTVNSYYYGVQFLLIAGFWPQQPPFWTTPPVPVPAGTLPPSVIAANLLSGFKAFDDGSGPAQTVKATLTAALGRMADR